MAKVQKISDNYTINNYPMCYGPISVFENSIKNKNTLTELFSSIGESYTECRTFLF